MWLLYNWSPGHVRSCGGITEYESNYGKLELWRREVDWIVYHSSIFASIFIRAYYLQYTDFLSLRDKELVIVSAVIPVHSLGRQGETKTVSVLARLSCTLGA